MSTETADVSSLGLFEWVIVGDEPEAKEGILKFPELFPHVNEEGAALLQLDILKLKKHLAKHPEDAVAKQYLETRKQHYAVIRRMLLHAQSTTNENINKLLVSSADLSSDLADVVAKQRIDDGRLNRLEGENAALKKQLADMQSEHEDMQAVLKYILEAAKQPVGV